MNLLWALSPSLGVRFRWIYAHDGPPRLWSTNSAVDGVYYTQGCRKNPGEITRQICYSRYLRYIFESLTGLGGLHRLSEGLLNLYRCFLGSRADQNRVVLFQHTQGTVAQASCQCP